MRSTLRYLVLLLALCVAGRATAQVEITPPRQGGGWTTVRVAKWALLGVALGFGSYALVQSRRADDAYAELQSRCAANNSACLQDETGSYADARSELLYDRAAAADRRAQIGIIGGQVTVLGSAALFVYDLRNGRGPADIPYPAPRSGYAVGLRLPF